MELLYCSGRGIRAQMIDDDLSSVPLSRGAVSKEDAPLPLPRKLNCQRLDLELDTLGTLTWAEIDRAWN